MEMNIKLNKKYVVPRLELILKVFVSVLIVNYIVSPFIFDNLALLNQLTAFWRTFATALIAVYLTLIFEVKLFGREWF